MAADTEDAGGLEARRRAAAQVFVADLDRPALTLDQAHHLGRVLRLSATETVVAADGAGRWRSCRFVERGDGSQLVVTGEISVAEAPRPGVGVALPLLKGERLEWAVQKLTEVGVDRLVLLEASRAVVRWGRDKADKGRRRLEKVAVFAAAQSRRAFLPVLTGPVVLGELAEEGGLALAEPGGGAPSLARPLVAVGPEGGWGAEELRLGLPLVDLGPTVLRAETAAVAAGVLLGALRAGTVGPSGWPEQGERSRVEPGKGT
jgi:16S rRNA (uracil1498-N3)-methyltransferase